MTDRWRGAATLITGTCYCNQESFQWSNLSSTGPAVMHTSGNHVIMSILLTQRNRQSALPVCRSACASTAATPTRGSATLGWSPHGRLERNQGTATNVCRYKGARQSVWGSWLGRLCFTVLMYKWGQFAPKKHTVSITAAVIVIVNSARQVNGLWISRSTQGAVSCSCCCWLAWCNFVDNLIK